MVRTGDLRDLWVTSQRMDVPSEVRRRRKRQSGVAGIDAPFGLADGFAALTGTTDDFFARTQ